MALDQFAQGNAHLLFHVARPVHVAGDAEELGAGVVGAADAREPGRAAAQNGRRDRDRLDVVHRGRAAIETGARRERRLQPRHALLALEALEQRGLLAADIGTGAAMDVEVEVPARAAGILAQKARVVGLFDRLDQVLRLIIEFAAHIDVAGMGAHREARDQAALDQQVRIVTHDVAILAGAGLRLVGIHDEIVRPVLHFLGHEGPLHAGREACATAAAQARFLHLVDDRVYAAVEDRLGVVPGATGTRAGQAPIVYAVEVGEDAVLVAEHAATRPSALSVRPRAPTSGGPPAVRASASRRAGTRRAPCSSRPRRGPRRNHR
jgi:hypothetical protein